MRADGLGFKSHLAIVWGMNIEVFLAFFGFTERRAAWFWLIFMWLDETGSITVGYR